VIGFFH